uniref:protein-serine/threonine phosphatase n=1 Tax=Aegilops tauschii TaxID=37682 RepID=M8BF71_AEGTA
MEVSSHNPDDAQIVVHTRGAWRIKGIIQVTIGKKLTPFVQSSAYLALCKGLDEVGLMSEMVSRSIGDVYLKKPEYSLDPLFRQIGPVIALKRPALSAEPQIHVRKLKPNDQFIIFASDGLWEHLSDDAAVQIVFKNPRTGIANRLVRAALKEATKKREVSVHDLRTIERGVRRHFHDDISVVVVYLDRHRGRRQTRVVDSSSNCTSAPVDVYSSSSSAYRDSG